jgi:DNA helicase-2/ATP-dependent DNA helicase PcrA
MAKELFTDRGDGPQPQLLEDFSTPAEEAAFIARTIRELVMREHLPYREIAVLYRTNAYSRAIEEALRRERIPYKLVGAVSFYQREEVKHFLAYLRLIHNPHDDQALLRIVNIPPRGIGEATLGKWQEKALSLGQSLWKSLPAVVPLLAPTAQQALLRFQDFVESLRARVATLPLPMLAEEVLRASGLIAYYREDMRAQERQENLEALLEAVSAYYLEGPEERDLPGFLTQLALYAPEDENQPQTDAVWLSTIHGVKGMEFNTVFLTGLIEGLLPHSRANEEGPEGEEEERRIFYVGLTRAAHRLYLCRPRLTGNLNLAEPSRFLEELRPLLSARQVKQPVFVKSSSHPVSKAPSLPAEAVGLSLSELRPGLPVHHSHFGRGTVLECIDNGAAGIVVINFDRFGKKRLDLRYARLSLA